MVIHRKKESLCCRLDKEDLCHQEDGKSQDNNLVCIYLLDKSNKCTFIYGCTDNFPKDFKKQLAENSIHINSHKKAFANNQVSYEWFLDNYIPVLYKTVLVPFTQEDGTVGKVLGIVRNVPSHLTDGKSFMMSEGDSPSIVRLMLKSREEEKRKLASLVHDEIGTAAVAINSLLAILKEDIKDGKIKAALSDADKLQKAVISSMAMIKKAIINLRPPQLEDVGLDSAVRGLLDSFCSCVDLQVDYNYKINDKIKISESVKIILFRIVQEALNNVVKHAQAKKVNICFSKRAKNIILTLQDDGIGYREEQSRDANKLGILGMKENISHIGGTFCIEGKMGKGTKIKVVCPINFYKRIV